MEIMLYNNNIIVRTERRIKIWITIFMGGLVLSGLTAFPLLWEINVMDRWLVNHGWDNSLSAWIHTVHDGVNDSLTKYPFIAYGTDWLAFAHLVIAIAFIGPLRDPIKNIWVIEFGIISCIAIFPLAFIAGEIRGIPFFWRLIDCAFGMAGGAALLYIHKEIKALERFKNILA